MDIISRTYVRLKKKREFIRERKEASIVIQKMFRGWKTRTQSYIRALELETNPWLYICREQKPFLLAIIKQMCRENPEYGNYLQISKNCFKITEKYCAVRILEPEAAVLPTARISHLIHPSFRSKITFNTWMKDLTNHNVFNNMMIFDEKETLRRIRVMKHSGLKFMKAKFLHDIKIVEQNSKSPAKFL